MAADAVIEDFNVFKYFLPSLLAGFVASVVCEFHLQCPEERFHRRIVVAVALAAHGCTHAISNQSISVSMTAILSAPFAVMN